MVDSDSDAALAEEVPINSNHQIIPNHESQWNSNNSHLGYRNRHSHHRRGGATKHHHGHTKSNFSHHDTNMYFEQARQARLLSKGDEITSKTINDPRIHADLERESEARNRGKRVDHTCDSRVNSSSFQWNKPLQNGKSKHGFCNPRGKGSSTSNGLSGQRKLVRDGCISPDIVARFGGKPSHIVGPSSHFAKQVVAVDSKGKEKVEVSDSSVAHRSDGGVMLCEPGTTSISNTKQRGLNERRRNYFTGKRKQRMDQPNLEESLTSVLGPPPKPSQKITIVNSSGEEGRETVPSCEEYWSMEEPELNNEELADESGKISQVESDELLARCLQEEFDQEVQNFQVSDEEDDDAIIARALQEGDKDYHDDDHDIMPFRRNLRELNDRDRSMEHLYLHGQHFPLEGPPMQISNRRTSQSRFNSADMDYEMMLISQLRRGLNSSHMDIETRLSIWEALEEAFENQSDMNIADDFYPVFQGDEYEILSALDEDDHRYAGATDGQINVLPISTVKADRVEDTCVICLDVPAVGDVVRHLPCLHKFHKECIDTWLRRKNACPVCKSAIT